MCTAGRDEGRELAAGYPAMCVVFEFNREEGAYLYDVYTCANMYGVRVPILLLGIRGELFCECVWPVEMTCSSHSISYRI